MENYLRFISRFFAVPMALLVGLLCSVELAPTSAAVIDFQSLEQINSDRHHQGKTYQEAGFTLTTSREDYDFTSLGTEHGNYAGSTALYSEESTFPIILKKTGGGTFDIFSIDLAELYADQPEVIFTGNKVGGDKEDITFILDGGQNQFETFYFTSFFTDLTSLTWRQERPFHQFDNIVLDVSVVPLPAAFPLYGAGLAVMGFLGWRRRSRQPVIN